VTSTWHQRASAGSGTPVLAGVGAEPRIEAHGASLALEPARERERRAPHHRAPGVSEDPDAAQALAHAYWR
jgi:hypothetical protein